MTDGREREMISILSRGLAVALVLCAALEAQKITAIRSSGSRRFTSAAIISASGLRLGEPFSPQVAAAAARRLGQTGAFANVQFNYAEDASGAAVTLLVTDQTQFARVRFDYFPGFSRRQLQQAVRGIPLYDGWLPLNAGTLTRAVTQRLQNLLRQAHIPGTVAHSLRHSMRHAAMTIVFHVRGVGFQAAQYHFPGAPAGLAATLEHAVKSDGAQAGLDRGYSSLAVAAFAQGTLRDLCMQQGFLGAQFGPPRAQPLPGQPQKLAILLPLQPGPRYRLGSIGCAGSRMVPCRELRQRLLRLSGLKAGAIVNFGKLQQAAWSLDSLYRSRGYFSARLVPMPRLNAQTRIARLQLQIHPGPQYSMGRLMIHGWGAAADARLASGWKLASGQPYSESYLKRFLLQHSQVLGDASYGETANSSTLQVNVTIHRKVLMEGGAGLP